MKVMKQCCNECLMGKNKVVSDERRTELLQEITSVQGYFVCHKASIAGDQEVCCKGFYDKLGHTSQMIRISERLNMVEYIKEKELQKKAVAKRLAADLFKRM